MKLSEIYTKIVNQIPKVDKELSSECQKLEEILSKLNELEQLLKANKRKMENNQIVYQIMKSFQNSKNNAEIDRMYNKKIY